MDPTLLIAGLALLAIAVIALVPLWVLDAIRARKARKADAKRWAAAQELAEHAPELGYQMRLELGALSWAELERVYIRITDTIATAGYVDRDMLTGWIALTRRELEELAAAEAPAED